MLFAGRTVLVKEPEKPGDEPIDITPKEFTVRTLCQEYGGGDFCIVGDTIFFSNYKDQRLYKQPLHLKGDPSYFVEKLQVFRFKKIMEI